VVEFLPHPPLARPALYTLYRLQVVMDQLEYCAPLIYTPTVGEACRKFDHIFRTPLGMYLSAFQHRGRFEQVGAQAARASRRPATGYYLQAAVVCCACSFFTRPAAA
jgi:malic enzyme